MFLKLDHQNLDVVSVTRQLVNECYKLAVIFPSEERYALMTQFRRAAVSIYLNTAEGFSRKSETERKRFFEIARGSLIEIDAILDIAADQNYPKSYNLALIGELIMRSFRLLSGLIKQ